tara:strand:- start:17 stop:727 length:711 start_codon:yes stop_codon:yes gene_type:complete
MKKRQIPQHLKDLIKAVGMSEQEATWDCHGTPVIYHDALERISSHIGIQFEKPEVHKNNVEEGFVAMRVTGTDGDKTEWSFGEASPYNSKNSYPFAMSEKRAKDRVILKLIGASGFVYSEEEAESFKNPNRHVEQKQQVKQEEPPPFEPDPNSISIIKTTLTEDQANRLEKDEYLMLQIPQQIAKLVDERDVNTWLNKNTKFLEMIKQKYSADYQIIRTAFNKKLDEFQKKGVNNG